MNLSALSLAMTRPGYAFSPASLFSAGEQGAWYDPSDLTTLFQDSAGTTPVTAVEQPVGLMLDKSKGLVLGPELVTNGDFSSGVGWTLGTGWSISSGAAVGTNATGNLLQTNVAPSPVGKTYRVTLTISNRTAGSIVPQIGSSTISLSADGTYTFYLRPSLNDATLYIPGSNFTGTVDNISVRELPGNHAIQSTSTSRPVLSARVNLLLNTETLGTQSVTTVATSYSLRFTGAGTITLSGTATGTFSAGTHSITATAGTLTLTVSGTVTQADLRVTNTGTNLPVYQRVNTATDYDTAGFPLYLACDGVDDWMQTNSIDFTATDKMTVVAGVRKLSDAAEAILVELSTIATVNGTFVLNSTFSAVNSAVRFLSRGTSAGQALGGALPSPVSFVASGLGDISGDSAILRINGTQAASSTADQGTGNYGNYPLFLFRRGGTTLPFNGRFYGLVVRGAATPTATLQSAENWMNQRTRAY